ncbi:MAG: CRTAC1 family protein [Acidobacteriota bacterium]|nr:MAG: CRTAC1 family protein [Acidobacteriota bacterium]
MILLTSPAKPGSSLSAQEAHRDRSSHSGTADGPVTFVDVARESGLTVENVWGGVEQKRYIIEAKGSGLAFFDYDHDGWLDIFVTNGVRFGETYTDANRPTSRLYRNRRDGTFEDVTVTAGLDRTGWQTGVSVGDYDNDGWDDLFCGFWGHDVLFRNNGDGTFREVTREAGLYDSEIRWSSGSVWLDFDRDGHLDLYVSRYIELDIDSLATPDGEGACLWKGIPVLCGPQGLPGGQDRLFRNKGDGTFEDVSLAAGILEPGPYFSITPVSYDFNRDGWPDIYVAVESQPSLFFVNQGDGTFEESGVIAGCAFSENGQEQAGMGIGVGDYDHDGWLDIFKTNFEHDVCNLYRNNGDGTFTDENALSGIGVNTRYVNWGAGFLDFDNDGWTDILLVTGHVYPSIEKHNLGISLKSPRVAYRNLGRGRFEDVSSRLGPGISQEFASRGCAFGDYDNDGDVDVVVLNMNDPLSLLRNDGGNRNNFIAIKLIGVDSNRSAIGALVRVLSDGISQIDEVHSGGSVMSQSDLRLHFGLGKSEKVELIEVKWPRSQKTETFRNVAANQFITIKEGEGILQLKEPGR